MPKGALLHLLKGKMPVKKKKELNSDKAAEPMYMHNEAATQNLVSSGNRACGEQDW